MRLSNTSTPVKAMPRLQGRRSCVKPGPAQGQNSTSNCLFSQSRFENTCPSGIPPSLQEWLPLTKLKGIDALTRLAEEDGDPCEVAHQERSLCEPIPGRLSKETPIHPTSLCLPQFGFNLPNCFGVGKTGLGQNSQPRHGWRASLCRAHHPNAWVPPPPPSMLHPASLLLWTHLPHHPAAPRGAAAVGASISTPQAGEPCPRAPMPPSTSHLPQPLRPQWPVSFQSRDSSTEPRRTHLSPACILQLNKRIKVPLESPALASQGWLVPHAQRKGTRPRTWLISPPPALQQRHD